MARAALLNDVRSLTSPTWSIGRGDPGHELLHGGTALEVLEIILADGKERHHDLIPRVLDYVSVHTPEVLSSAAFLATSLPVVERILECPGLAMREDDLLEHVLQYAARCAGADSEAPSLWSADEAAAADPILRSLLPRLAILSVSPTVFVKLVEPLDVFPKKALASKYRFDALMQETLANGESERDMVLAFYGGSSRISGGGAAFVGVPRLRATILVHESEHPHEIGVDRNLARVAVAGWAGRIAIEFDSRTAIAQDAALRFYGDKHGEAILAEWEGPPARSQRIVLDENEFWIGFECSVLTPKAGWGWKFCVRALPDD